MRYNKNSNKNGHKYKLEKRVIVGNDQNQKYQITLKNCLPMTVPPLLKYFYLTLKYRLANKGKFAQIFMSHLNVEECRH